MIDAVTMKCYLTKDVLICEETSQTKPLSSLLFADNIIEVD